MSWWIVKRDDPRILNPTFDLGVVWSNDEYIKSDDEFLTISQINEYMPSDIIHISSDDSLNDSHV